MDVDCSSCGARNHFDQPYAYHAGHADQGFLYNDAGTRTLVWSSYDAAWEAVAGRVHPWTLGAKDWARVEALLQPAPDGGRWRAANPPRCLRCGAPIGRGMGEHEISYLVYADSVILDDGPSGRTFAAILVMAPGQPNGR